MKYMPLNNKHALCVSGFNIYLCHEIAARGKEDERYKHNN